MIVKSNCKCNYPYPKGQTECLNRPLPSSYCAVIWYRNYGTRTRLSAKSFSLVWRVKCRGGEIERKFLEIQCGRVKNYLWERGIQLGDGGKGKKKAELFDLCKNAATMKQIQLAASAEDCKSC